MTKKKEGCATLWVKNQMAFLISSEPLQEETVLRLLEHTVFEAISAGVVKVPDGKRAIKFENTEGFKLDTQNGDIYLIESKFYFLSKAEAEADIKAARIKGIRTEVHGEPLDNQPNVPDKKPPNGLYL